MENKNALDEISKGTLMGMDAINYILGKVNNKDFKKVLEKEYKKYQNIDKKIDNIYGNYSEGSKRDINLFDKTMSHFGMEMKTLTDSSDSKIAELLIKGTNMGIIEGRKILNNKNINDEVNDLINEFVLMQENSIEEIKKYL